MLKHVLFLLTAIMFFSNHSIMAQQSEFSFNIEFVDTPPIKKTFWLFGKETLKIKANIVNNSQDSIYFEKMVLNCNINFKITDTTGQEMQVNIPMVIDPQINNNFFLEVKPQDKYSISVDIFDINKYNLNIKEKYNLSATYSANYAKYFKGDKDKLFQGILESNVIILEK